MPDVGEAEVLEEEEHDQSAEEYQEEQDIQEIMRRGEEESYGVLQQDPLEL